MPRPTMSAWATDPARRTIELIERRMPRPAPDELLVEVRACGVCRTDLHVIDGDLETRRPRVVPGHQAVGHVVAAGHAVRDAPLGALVGVPWLRRTCGRCDYCRQGRENLCEEPHFTGWDADGGYADFVTVPEAFAYRLPSDENPVEVAPLLCAGIIGYRAYRRARLRGGGLLGIYGFGSSGHLTAQLAIAQGHRVAAFTKGGPADDVARRVGAEFIGAAEQRPPEPLDASIVFAAAGELVPAALAATRPGGTVVLAGISMTQIPALRYEKSLFHERDLRSVTANTRADGAEYLALAGNLGIRADVTRYAFEDADRAVDDLRDGDVAGSLVLVR